MTGYRPSRGRQPRVVIAKLRPVMPVAFVSHLRFLSAHVECLPRPVERLSRTKWRGRRAAFALVFSCAPPGARHPIQPLKRVRLGHNRRRPRSPDAPLRGGGWRITRLFSQPEQRACAVAKTAGHIGPTHETSCI
jgi:hypothetical protein